MNLTERKKPMTSPELNFEENASLTWRPPSDEARRIYGSALLASLGDARSQAILTTPGVAQGFIEVDEIVSAWRESL